VFGQKDGDKEPGVGGITVREFKLVEVAHLNTPDRCATEEGMKD
jgi:hypothetical protein